ncbi:MAG: type II toxin-antitoxin system HicA family toxin [Spirochaetaceae bacterium]|jgi:predicted RNA binding protein YcfA (HicA-like mRNA interferase family)|nr:type II toxin-antitoxin system HicA family toxin [Spirochaetaceae bacterium]
MKFAEIQKIVIGDGWYLVRVNGSHYQYRHAVKKGGVTIPRHTGDIPQTVINSILKQAGLK